MDRALQKLYNDRKEFRKNLPPALSGVQVPELKLGELSQFSVDSLRSPRSETFRLPKIAKVKCGGSTTYRCARASNDHVEPHRQRIVQRLARLLNAVATAQRVFTDVSMNSNSTYSTYDHISLQARLTSAVVRVHHQFFERLKKCLQHVDGGETTSAVSAIRLILSRNYSENNTAWQQEEDRPKYVTLKATVEEITFTRDEMEEDLALQASLSLDTMTGVTRVQKKTNEETIVLKDENFMFHVKGSPVGAMLMVKLIGVRRSDTVDLGSALFDLSTINVGSPYVHLTCDLHSEMQREKKPTVALSLKLCPRRKSFTFSYLRDEPLFHCSGYTITAEGILQFPQPYKKNGMPAGVSFADLKIVSKAAWADSINGFEVFKAIDKRGGSYTVKKFSIMQTECRDFLVSSLDGMLDALPENTICLCDAFLVGAKVCMVLDEMGGVYLRDALLETGACPEMVASIIIRQILIGIQHLHERKSRLHMDIDARNILCLKDGECRLSGFCYSTKCLGRTSKFSGPFYHMSPERLLGLECSFAADVWSIGILAIELALGKGPYNMSQFQGPNGLFEFRKTVASEDSPTLKGVSGVSDIYRSFVTMCLHKNISVRASPSELLEHQFIQRYETFLLPAGSWLVKKKKPTAEINYHIERFGNTNRDVSMQNANLSKK